MPNTYTQLYNHYVIVVRYRSFVIHKSWKNDMYSYIAGIIERQGHKMYIINGMPDHVHILVSMSPNQAPSGLMYNVKRSSSLWINWNRLMSGRNGPVYQRPVKPHRDRENRYLRFVKFFSQQ